MTSPTVLQLDDVGAAYDGRSVLSGVTLALHAGELLVLLGANGSGKSTLVRTVLGLTPTSTGSVSLFGEPQKAFRDWARVGYVPQRAGATSGVPATVREVVAAGRLPRMRRFGRSGPADRRAVTAALEVVGLAGREKDSISTLSGGQQQRALIARALACEPELLILDEPTSGVDATVQMGLAETFARLMGDGIAILLVAHELGPIAPLTRRAVVLRDGRVVHDGAPPEMDHLHGLDPEHAHPPHDPHAHHRHSMTGWAL